MLQRCKEETFFLIRRDAMISSISEGHLYISPMYLVTCCFIFILLLVSFFNCINSWKVNGEEKTAMAIQKNFTSQLKFTADINAVVNCTAANQFGMDWKATNIAVTG